MIIILCNVCNLVVRKIRTRNYKWCIRRSNDNSINGNGNL